jgi:predicted enzyme related to lactoylglutathione lyase
MPEPTDAFEALRRPIVPARPRPEFAAALRRQLNEELPLPTDHGSLKLVHVAVRDAEQAMRFFGSLFGWEGERYATDFVSYYTLNTAVTVRFLDDPNAPALRPNYAVADVSTAVLAIEAAGGRVTESEVSPDGGGWAYGTDRAGLPLVVFKPYDRDHSSPQGPVSGDVALLFMKADAGTASEFYGSVLGWDLAPAHPGSTYYDAAEHVGVWDENAALGTSNPPSLALYVEVPALRPAIARIEELGGHCQPVPETATMGHFYNLLCTDDQGTVFGLMSAAVDEGEA